MNYLFMLLMATSMAHAKDANVEIHSIQLRFEAEGGYTDSFETAEAEHLAGYDQTGQQRIRLMTRKADLGPSKKSIEVVELYEPDGHSILSSSQLPNIGDGYNFIPRKEYDAIRAALIKLPVNNSSPEGDGSKITAIQTKCPAIVSFVRPNTDADFKKVPVRVTKIKFRCRK